MSRGTETNFGDRAAAAAGGDGGRGGAGGGGGGPGSEGGRRAAAGEYIHLGRLGLCAPGNLRHHSSRRVLRCGAHLRRLPCPPFLPPSLSSSPLSFYLYIPLFLSPSLPPRSLSLSRSLSRSLSLPPSPSSSLSLSLSLSFSLSISLSRARSLYLSLSLSLPLSLSPSPSLPPSYFSLYFSNSPSLPPSLSLPLPLPLSLTLYYIYNLIFVLSSLPSTIFLFSLPLFHFYPPSISGCECIVSARASVRFGHARARPPVVWFCIWPLQCLHPWHRQCVLCERQRRRGRGQRCWLPGTRTAGCTCCSTAPRCGGMGGG